MPFDRVQRLEAKKNDPHYNTRGGGGYQDQLEELTDRPRDKGSEEEEPERGSPEYYRQLDREREETFKKAPPRRS